MNREPYLLNNSPQGIANLEISNGKLVGRVNAWTREFDKTRRLLKSELVNQEDFRFLLDVKSLVCQSLPLLSFAQNRPKKFKIR